MVTQALWEALAAVRIVAYTPLWETNDYGRPFGGDEAHFKEVEDQGNT
jgi:hypothetical protein